MVLIKLDHRETKLHQIFRGMGITHKVEHLSVGDIQYGPLVVERKEIEDYILSFQDRLWNQCKAMVEKFDAPVVIITGDIHELAERYKERGTIINLKAIRGAIASTYIRYGVPTIWLPNDVELVSVFLSMKEKVDQGKLGIPHKIQALVRHRDKRIDALTILFGLTEKQAQGLLRFEGSIKSIFEDLEKRSYRLTDVPGIGDVTVRKMRKVYGGW